MPLDWLGQLKPSMKQQIALQRALLALQREDEEIRARTMPQAAQPALARGLGAGPSAGPRNIFDNARAREIYESHDFTGTPSTGHFRPGAGSLEEILRAAQPTPGYISGEERMRTAREEIAAGKEELAGKASEFWARIEPLDDAGEKIALDACRKHQPDLYEALIEQGYVDKATGAAVGLEKEKKVAFKTTRISDGWEYEDLVFEDGTTESRTLGPAPEEAVAGLTPSEELGWARLNFDVAKEGVGNILEAIKNAGGILVEGEMVKRPGETEYRAARPEDVQRRYDKVRANLDYQRVVTEGPKSIGDLKTMFEHDPESVKNLQRNAGITVDGVWSDALGQWLWDNFYKEE